jgi:hypothetical protein
MLRILTWPWGVALLLLAVGYRAEGTDRFYRDVTAVSADGKLRLEAKSPDNAGGRDQPFAKNFVYVLTEAATGRHLWDRKQGEREGPPLRAFVHDGGWVVVRTGYDELLLFDPRGVAALNLDILRDAIPAAEVKAHVRNTTAGPMWADYSHWYFFTWGGRPFFGFRTWWDRRVIISLREAKAVPDEGAIRHAANAAEREFVLATLQAGAKVARKWAAKKLPVYPPLDTWPWDKVDHLATAVHLAGRTSLKEAAQLLRLVEQVPSSGSSVSAHEDAPAGDLFLASCRIDSTRQQVHLALRRVGERPAVYPVREMKRAGAARSRDEPYHPPQHATPRARRVDEVSKRSGPKDVVDTIGEPDYLTRPAAGDGEADWVWEYDIDADSPYTLRIVWAGRRIRSISKVEPPSWKDSNKRDLQD